jgi:hypothetical protein
VLTFTPNWLPGGTPVLPQIWSVKRGFWKTSSDQSQVPAVKLSIHDIRPGGKVRYCMAAKELLPMIHVHDGINGEAPQIRGLDAELIRVHIHRRNMNILS